MRTTKDPLTRREDILQASYQLFKEVGYEQTKVEHIAKQAGIAKGSFYNYFKSKEEVYEAVVSTVALHVLSVTEDILTQENLPPKMRLISYLDWTFQFANEPEKSISRILSQETKASHRKIYQLALDESAAHMLPFFAALLQEGMDSKEFTIPNASYTAAFILGAFRGIHMAFYNQLKVDIDTSKVYMYELLAHLLGTKFD